MIIWIIMMDIGWQWGRGEVGGNWYSNPVVSCLVVLVLSPIKVSPVRSLFNNTKLLQILAQIKTPACCEGGVVVLIMNMMSWWRTRDTVDNGGLSDKWRMDLVSVVPSLGQPLSLSHIEISAGSPALVCQPITGSVIMLTWPTYSVTRWC